MRQCNNLQQPDCSRLCHKHHSRCRNKLLHQLPTLNRRQSRSQNQRHRRLHLHLHLPFKILNRKLLPRPVRLPLLSRLRSQWMPRHLPVRCKVSMETPCNIFLTSCQPRHSRRPCSAVRTLLCRRHRSNTYRRVSLGPAAAMMMIKDARHAAEHCGQERSSTITGRVLPRARSATCPTRVADCHCHRRR